MSERNPEPTAILEAVIRVIGETVYEKTGRAPLENSADRFENETFAMHAYDWSDEGQPWNFKCGDIEVTWYKYWGRGMRANREVWGKEALLMMANCLRSLEEPNLLSQGFNMSKEQTDWVMVPREATSEMCRAQPDNASTDDVAFYRSKWRAMLSAAPASPSPAGGVQGMKVDPLEWAAVTDQIPKHAFAAYTPFTRWLIVCEFLSMNHMVYRFNGADYETLDEAKAAAQSDYEQRILSALSSQAQTTGGERNVVIEEAALRAGVDAGMNTAERLSSREMTHKFSDEYFAMAVSQDAAKAALRALKSGAPDA